MSFLSLIIGSYQGRPSKLPREMSVPAELTKPLENREKTPQYRGLQTVAYLLQMFLADICNCACNRK